MTDEANPDEAMPHELAQAAEHLGLPLVPPDVSRRFREVFHAQLPHATAHLIADTRDTGTLAGVRGGASAAWSMSYRAEPCDIVLDLEHEGRAIRINGQLLCPDPTPDSVVRVYRTDELIGAGSTDEFGQFELGALAPASYTITVTRTDRVIEVPVDLSEPSR